MDAASNLNKLLGKTKYEIVNNRGEVAFHTYAEKPAQDWADKANAKIGTKIYTVRSREV